MEATTQRVDTALLPEAQIARLRTQTLSTDEKIVSNAIRKIEMKCYTDLPYEIEWNRFEGAAKVMLHAYSLAKDKFYQDAEPILDHLDEFVGVTKFTVFLRAGIYSSQFQHAKAWILYHRLMKEDPCCYRSLRGMADVHLASKEYDKASALLLRSKEIEPKQWLTLYLYGLSQYRSGHVYQAEQAFLECTRYAPLFAPAYRKLAEIARHAKNDNELFYHYYNQAHSLRLREKLSTQMSRITSFTAKVH